MNLLATCCVLQHTNKKMKKVKLSLSTPQMHTGGLKVQLHSFSTLVPEGGEWSTTCSTSRKETQYPLNSRLGGPHNWSGHFREQNIFFPLPGFKPDYSAHSLVSISITLSRLPTHYYFNSANLRVCHLFNSCMCCWK